MNVSFHFKHIAEALAADNVSSICADFLTEAGDMDVDGAVCDDDASPDSVHELLAGEDISTILQQEDEQVELSTCEVDGLAVDADGLAVEADLETAEGEKTLAEAGVPNVPEIETMREMLGPDHQWPMDVVWGMHDYTRGGAQGCNGFTDYIRRSYAEPKNLDEFTRLAQAVEYENHKAMFESVYAKGGNGILMWMSQSAWPSMVWQTYDYWHDVNGGFYGAKVGNQPVNVILNQNARRFIAVNATGVPFSGKAKVEFFDIDGRRLEAKEEAVSLEADGRVDLFGLPAMEAKEGVLLIRATIGKAENFTWINAKKDRDYRALVPLLYGSAELSATKVVAGSSGAKGEVTVSNTSDRPQLLVSLKLVDAKGRRVLPVHWSDNFISLMPGESRRVSFEATSVDKALVPGLRVVQRVTKFRAPGEMPFEFADDKK